jgi:6-phosphofructokinase 1
MPTQEAIKRREVDISEIALYESLGACFGRTPAKYEFELLETTGAIKREL